MSDDEIGYSKQESNLFGSSRTGNYDRDGNKTGTSKQEESLLSGTRTVHRDTDGTKTGTSKQESTWTGEQRAVHRDSEGSKTGYSRAETASDGTTVTRHFNNDGQEVAHTKEETSFFGGKRAVHYSGPAPEGVGGWIVMLVAGLLLLLFAAYFGPVIFLVLAWHNWHNEGARQWLLGIAAVLALLCGLDLAYVGAGPGLLHWFDEKGGTHEIMLRLIECVNGTILVGALFGMMRTAKPYWAASGPRIGAGALWIAVLVLAVRGPLGHLGSPAEAATVENVGEETSNSNSSPYMTNSYTSSDVSAAGETSTPNGLTAPAGEPSSGWYVVDDNNVALWEAPDDTLAGTPMRQLMQTDSVEAGWERGGWLRVQTRPQGADESGVTGWVKRDKLRATTRAIATAAEPLTAGPSSLSDAEVRDAEEALTAALTDTAVVAPAIASGAHRHGGKVGNWDTSLTLTWDLEGRVRGTYYFLGRENQQFQLTGRVLNERELQLTEFAQGREVGNGKLCWDGTAYVGVLRKLNGEVFSMRVEAPTE